MTGDHLLVISASCSLLSCFAVRDCRRDYPCNHHFPDPFVRDDPKRRERIMTVFVASCPVSTVSRHVRSTQKEHFLRGCCKLVGLRIWMSKPPARGASLRPCQFSALLASWQRGGNPPSAAQRAQAALMSTACWIAGGVPLRMSIHADEASAYNRQRVLVGPAQVVNCRRSAQRQRSRFAG